MHTVASESLLDEADFLAELALLEHGLPEKRQPLLADEARLPDVLAPVRTEKPGKFWEPARPTERATFVEENEDDFAHGRTLRRCGDVRADDGRRCG